MTSFVHSYDPRPPKLSSARGWSPVTKNGKLNPVGPDGKKGAWATPAGAPTTTKPYVAPDVSSAYQDSIYNDTTAGIGANLNNLQTYLTNQGNAGSLESGVNYQFAPVADDPSTPQNEANPFALKQLGTNPDGTPKYFDIADNVDVTNPFSRAALLKRSYMQAKAGNTNSYAARGQLYSGALQNAQNDADFQNLGGQNSLIKDVSSGIGGLIQQWVAGQNTATDQNIGAQGAAIDRHLGDPISAPSGTVDIAYKNTAAAGLTVGVGPNGLVVKDSKGNVIPGATVHVQGKRRFIRVPRGA